MWGSDRGLRSFVVINYVIAVTGTFAAENLRHSSLKMEKQICLLILHEALTVEDLDKLFLAQDL